MTTIGSSTKVNLEVDTMNYWEVRWKEQKTGWQLNKVNPNLIDNLERLAPNGVPRKFFLPLCGGTFDIGYLISKGHSVFAVEGVKKAIEQLNERDKLQLEFNEETSLFSSPDGRIVIYIGDMFECPIENWGPFDCVWDRASLIAISYNRRAAYLDIIKRSVQKSKKYIDFRMLLEATSYPKHLYEGPPLSVEETDMIELFSDWSNFETLQIVEEGSFSALRKKIPEAYPCNVAVYWITPKV